jgi:hypothetical protein
MMPLPASPSTVSTITYTATANDTLPGICARFYPQTGYGSYAQLLADTMTANAAVVQDWTAPLGGLTLLIPTVGS